MNKLCADQIRSTSESAWYTVSFLCGKGIQCPHFYVFSSTVPCCELCSLSHVTECHRLLVTIIIPEVLSQSYVQQVSIVFHVHMLLTWITT